MPATMGDATRGIRPEHVVHSPAGDAGLEALEALAEPTGYGIVLHLTLAEEALKVLTHDLPRIEPGPAVGVPFPEGALHLFNARGVRV